MPAAFSSYAIVPAAGRSARMGQPKLLLDFRGQTIIETVLDAWLASSVDRTLVVVHPDDHALADVCEKKGATVIVPQEPPPHMKDSVLAGLDYLSSRCQPKPESVWLLAPADMPTLSSRVIDAVLSAHDPEHPRILVATRQKKRGHPVLFPWPLAGEVARLGPEEGLNQLVGRHDVQEVPVSEECIHFDVDTPEDYERLRKGNP